MPLENLTVAHKFKFSSSHSTNKHTYTSFPFLYSYIFIMSFNNKAFTGPSYGDIVQKRRSDSMEEDGHSSSCSSSSGPHFNHQELHRSNKRSKPSPQESFYHPFPHGTMQIAAPSNSSACFTFGAPQPGAPQSVPFRRVN